MGASSSSTRRLTTKNEDPRIVQVTEDVVNRLRSAPPPPTGAALSAVGALPDVISGHAASAPSGSGSDETTGGENTDPVVFQNPNQSSSAVNSPSTNVQTVGVLNVGPDGRSVIETVTAFQMRQQKEQELRYNDRLWLAKLRELETRYASSAFASQEEFNSELEKLKKLLPQRKENPCKSLSDQVAECYSSNSKQPLRCAEEVKHFAQCVDKVRAA